MSTQENFLNTLITYLDEMQAQEIKTIDVKQETTITDYMIICSGRSSRHVKAIAETLIEYMKKNMHCSVSSQGISNGEWALIDLKDIIVHIMQDNVRKFYNLEELWQPKVLSNM